MNPLTPKDIRDHVKQFLRVPVLAESKPQDIDTKGLGEARESTNSIGVAQSRPINGQVSHSHGAQQLDTIYCERCQMNVWKSRIEHHRTWCNPYLAALSVSDDGKGLSDATLADQKASQSMELDKVESLSDLYDHHPQSFTEWLANSGDSI